MKGEINWSNQMYLVEKSLLYVRTERQQKRNIEVCVGIRTYFGWHVKETCLLHLSLGSRLRSRQYLTSVVYDPPGVT